MGKVSGKFKLAEAWQRHSHLGYGPEGFDPLCEALAKYVIEAGQKGRATGKRAAKTKQSE
jgi:hypothetical protein